MYSHFRLKKDSSMEYRDMLFFDDEYGNIQDISSLGMLGKGSIKSKVYYHLPAGVTCYYIEDDQGITFSRFKEGLQQFSRS